VITALKVIARAIAFDMIGNRQGELFAPVLQGQKAKSSAADKIENQQAQNSIHQRSDVTLEARAENLRLCAKSQFCRNSNCTRGVVVSLCGNL